MAHERRMNKALMFSGGSLIALALFQGGAALAQTDDADASPGDDIVIVVANKRAESIQDVPLAITVQTGEFIADARLNDVKDLVTFTPGVTGNSQDSFIDTLSVRGILTNDFGVGGDASISIYKDGLYQGRNGAVVTSLFDIERAEVLRGPQNFLFGRSSIGGAISVITKKPVIGENGGYIDLEVATYDRTIAEGALNIAAGDNLAFRLAGYSAEQGGYVDNIFTPESDDLIASEKYALRGSALYEAGPLSVHATIEFEERAQAGTIYQATGLGEGFEIIQTYSTDSITATGRDINSDFSLGNRDDSTILSTGLQVDYDLGWGTLTSLTGFKDHTFDYAEDYDGTSLAINSYAQDQAGTYFEQEARVVSDYDGPFNWYAGVSYYNEEIDADFAQQGSEEVFCAYYYFVYYGVDTFGSCLTDVYYGLAAVPEGLLETNQVRGRYDGWSAYVDATYDITDTFDIGVGLRYTVDNRDFAINAPEPTSGLGPYFALGFTTVGFLEDSASFDGLTPRFIARYRPTDDWSLFASATRGYKAGGYASFAIAPDQPFGTTDVTRDIAGPDIFDAETVWSYEVGAKGNLFDNRLIVDANVYYYDYKDLQQTIAGNGGGILVENVGEAKGIGLEGSITARLTDYFDMVLNGAVADTEISSAEAVCDDTTDCEGNQLPHVPDFSGAAIVNFHAPLGLGDLIASAELFGQTETYGGFLLLPEAVNDGYFDLSFTVGYEAANQWSVVGFVENVTDEIYYDGATEGSGVLPAHYFGPSRPRTFGVRVSYDFGN